MCVCVSQSVCADCVFTWKLVFSSDAPASTSSRHTACCFSEAALCNAVSPLHRKHKDSVESQQPAPKLSNDNSGRTSLCLTDPEAPLSLKQEEAEAALENLAPNHIIILYSTIIFIIIIIIVMYMLLLLKKNHNFATSCFICRFRWSKPRVFCCKLQISLSKSNDCW